jgi:hypothetical protein
MARSQFIDNPVWRHTGRRAAGGRLALLLVGTLLLVAAGTGVLQHYWLQYSVYAGGPRLYARWFYLFLLAEVFIVVPWSAIRSAALWRQLEVDGQLEEYRRTRLSPLAIVVGGLLGGLKPVVLFLLLSAGLGVGLALLAPAGPGGEGAAPSLLQTLGAHGLLLVLAGAFAAMGQLLAGWTRTTVLAVPLCLALLAGATGAIWFLNPYYREMSDPDRWIGAFLLPNPAVAVATAVGMDLLRYQWIYDHVRAQDYFSMGFAYPSPWCTAAVYALLGMAAALLSARRLDRREEG